MVDTTYIGPNSIRIAHVALCHVESIACINRKVLKHQYSLMDKILKNCNEIKYSHFRITYQIYLQKVIVINKATHIHYTVYVLISWAELLLLYTVNVTFYQTVFTT